MSVFTSLGKGRIVHTFPDGTHAVELSHGGGHIFHPGEVRRASLPHNGVERRSPVRGGRTVIRPKPK